MERNSLVAWRSGSTAACEDDFPGANQGHEHNEHLAKSEHGRSDCQPHVATRTMRFREGLESRSPDFRHQADLQYYWSPTLSVWPCLRCNRRDGYLRFRSVGCKAASKAMQRHHTTAWNETQIQLYQRRPQTEQCSKMRSPNNMASSIS